MHNQISCVVRLSTFTAVLCACPALMAQQESIIDLRNGMRLGPGITLEIGTLSTDSFQQGDNSGSKSIGVVEDGLRRTYHNIKPQNVLNVQPSDAPRFTQIELPNLDERERVGDAPEVRAILGVTQFSQYGRRIFSFMSPRGQVDVVQGITLLTPKFAKVEVLRAEPDSFVWDQRIAISSIPAEQLKAILHQALDMKQAGSWLQLTAFYLEAERYKEAHDTISEALRLFPTELADRQGLIEMTQQRLATQLFDEIKLRKNAGQYALAGQLTDFPSNSLPIETQVKLQQEVETIKQQVLAITQVNAALQEAVAKLPADDQQLVAAIAQEISDEISFDTAVRFADFQRLRADASIPNENLVSLAIGGWLLGVDAGIQNFAVAKSLIRVRALVREYLSDADQLRRQTLLEQLASEEGAQAPLLAKMLATLKPVKALSPEVEADPPGLHRQSVTTAAGDVVNYLIQLPPEYDPNRKYPCVLALPGTDEPPDIEIQYWCGVSVPTPFGDKRMGEASRFGYIVVAPDWMQSSATRVSVHRGRTRSHFDRVS
ncbi:MAG: hypothetical protein R3C53_09465 [Pirellulaceae bacterium]